MKNLFITIIAVLSFTTTFAQEDDIRFGAKAGVNLSNVTGSFVFGNKALIGFHVGGLVEIPNTEQLAFQPELLYSSQGYKTDFSNTFDFFGETDTNSIEATSKLNYISLPLMFKYYVVEGLSLQAGPQISFLASASVDYIETINGEVIEEISDSSTEGLSAIDFGLNFGAGYQLEMGLFFDARYNLGLSNLLETSDIEDDFLSFGTPTIKNTAFQISVGYKF